MIAARNSSHSYFRLETGSTIFRDGPLEKLWWGWGIFEPQEFFLLSNSLYEFFLGRSMNIFLGLIGVHDFFFI